MAKRILSMVLCLCLAVTALLPLGASAEAEVTRGEWISKLVGAFSMSVQSEADMPDNYFSDVTADMANYRDILLAVEFGVIDLEAGEAFEPDKPATREFAAQTLNFCLKFQLDKDTEYTYSEAEEVSCPDDIQVAVNRGWFALYGNDFLPKQSITTAEAEATLADAKSVLSKENIDKDYDSKYQFADNVKVIPSTADVSISTDYTVTVTGYECGVNAGDVFVAYSAGIPVVLKAIDVKTDGDVTTITAAADDAEGVITSVDSEGVAEFDLENFETAEVETYSVTDADSNETSEMQISLQSINYDKKAKKLIATKEIKVSGTSNAGSITVEVSDINLFHKENTNTGEYMAYIQGNTSITKSISFDIGNYVGIPSSITLGYINISGIGSVTLNVDLSLKGGMSSNETGIITAGFSYARNDGFRLINGYKKTAYSFTAEAEVKVGLTLSANIDLVVMSGRIWATVGVKGYFKFKDYTYVDGERPLQCKTIGGFLYANVGASASINYFIDKKSWSKTVDIYTESNSPVRVYYHYEDNQLVDACTRGRDNNEAYIKYTTHTNSAYFNPSPSYGRGSYTGGDGTTKTLWTYTTDSEGNATITGYKGSASSLAIPSVIDGYKVTKIGNEAFKNNKNVVNVTIPNGVTNINWGSFENCERLKSVIIPDSVVEIGGRAFLDCINLENFRLPPHLTCLWQDIIKGTKVRSITVPKTLERAVNYGPFAGAEYLTEVNFEYGTANIVYYLCRGIPNIERIEIPDTVTVISDSAFKDCEKLKEVIIPDSVVEIKGSAFENCKSLENFKMPQYLTCLWDNIIKGTRVKSVTVPKTLERTVNNGPFAGAEYLTEVNFEYGTTNIVYYLCRGIPNIEKIEIPDTVTLISDSAFKDCEKLKEIIIPDSVVEIEGRAFENCKSLENFKLPPYLTCLWQDIIKGTKVKSVTVPKTLERTVNYGPFAGAEYLTEVNFEHGTTNIVDYLCREIPNIEKIEIPDTVTVISGRAFESCEKLKEIIIPNSVAEIKTNAFKNCTDLSNIKLPDNIKTLGCGLFNGCKSLKEISIPDSTSKIDDGIFVDCVSLEKAVLPNTMDTIPVNTFYNCKNLSEIKLPDGLQTIEYSAFYGCNSLSSINLPNNLQTIGDSAFYECKALTDITIPKSVTYVGSQAFYNCDGLQNAVINASGTIGSQAFYDCDALTNLTLADSVTKIGSSLCYDCDKLTDIKFGKYITEIPDSAFRKCASLQTVTLPRFCKTVVSNAFAEDTKLTEAYVPISVTGIQTNSFSYPKKMTMYGKDGSYAQEYAAGRDMPFGIVDKPITTIAYTDSEVKMSRYATVLPSMQVMPEFDTDTITFSSDNTNVATVSENGTIKAGYTYGTANVTAKTTSGLSANIKVTVVKPASTITLNKSALEISAGKSEKLTATISPSDSTDNIVWTSDNTDVAAVDKDGNVTGIKKGTATVTAKAVYGNASASCLVTVEESGVEIVDVTGVALAPGNAEITISKTLKLSASVLPENATNKLLVWSSSNSNVASVSADGIVTAKTLGTAKITVKTVSGSYESTCTVTVVPKVEITEFSCENMGGYGLIKLSAVNVPQSCEVFIAAYGANQKVTSIKKLTLSNGSVQTIIPLENVDKLKAFIWDFKNLKPLAVSKTK